MTPEEILNLPLDDNAAQDSRAKTIRGYLVALAREVWNEGEGFSGKRPFGNSGWQFDLYATLVKNNAIPGTFDEDGYLDKCDDGQANHLIAEAIDALDEA